MKPILILSCLIISINLISQFEQLGNYQNLTNLSIINPSFSGEKTSTSIILNKNIFGNSQLYSFNYNSHLNGFNISHFNNGYRFHNFYNRNSTTLQYARLFKISKSNNLRIGASIAQNSFPVYYSLNSFYKRETHITSKAGLVLEREQFYFGISGLNIPLSIWPNSLSKNLLSIQSGLKLKLKKNTITSSFYFLKYKLGYNLQYSLKYQRKWLEINAGYNNHEQFLIGLGVNYKRINFRYSYNFLFSKLSLAIHDNHNFQLTYQLYPRCTNSVINNFF